MVQISNTDAISRIELETSNLAELLCHMDFNPTPSFNHKTHQSNFYEFLFANTLNDEPDIMPIEYANIRDHQQKDDELKQMVKEKKQLPYQDFSWNRKRLWNDLQKQKIVISLSLKEKVLE